MTNTAELEKQIEQMVAACPISHNTLTDPKFAFYEVVRVLPCEPVPEQLWNTCGAVVGRTNALVQRPEGLEQHLGVVAREELAVAAA